MNLLAGPGRPNRRLWMLSAVAAALLYAFWPRAQQDDSDIVAVVRPHRTSPANRQRETRSALGFARRVFSEVSTNPFASHSWYVAPPAPPAQVSAPVAPSAPPLPYTYLGRYSRAGEKPVFFLVKADRVYDAHIGDVLEKQYSVDSAENGQLKMTYLPLGIQQSLQVGETP